MYENNSKDELVKIIEQLELELSNKKYGLVWDKEREPEQVVLNCQNNLPILKEVEDKHIKTDDSDDHILIEGDNYHALSVLNYTHENKIDVIYIDPPYNTGSKDFIYNDFFVEKEDKYRHSKWLNFMEKRLNLAKNLLKKDGVVFISIDDNEAFNLKLLCDKIFGETNFLGNIIRNTNSTKNQSNYLSITYDHTLVYAKNESVLNEIIKESKTKWEVDKNNIDEYIKQIKQLKKKGLSAEEITLELKELTKYPRFIDFVNYWYIDEHFEKKGVYMKDNLGGVKSGNMTPIFNPLTNEFDPVPPGGFRYSEVTLQELDNDGRIHFHTDGSLPRLKRYLFENKKSRPKGIMSDDQRPDYTLLKNMGLEFDNPKQLKFLERVFSIFKDDILVLDFFAGSGSTAHALLNMNEKDNGNRKFIICTNNENNICEEVTYPRVSKVINGYTTPKKKTIDGLQGNLKYFKTELLSKSKSHFQTKIALVNECTEMLCIKENIYNLEVEENDFKIFSSNDKTRYLAIYYNTEDDTIEDFLEHLRSIKEEKTVYMFSESEEIDRTIFAGIKKCILTPIPQKILNVYYQLNKQNIAPKTNTIFVDLDKAKRRIFVEKDKDDGASKLRIVLEQIIEVIAYKEGLNLNDFNAIARVNTKLKDDGVFSKVTWKENEKFLTIGNDASHGDYDNYDIKQVEEFYKYVQSMITEFGVGK